jgi:predicted nucleic acid-binding protein
MVRSKGFRVAVNSSRRRRSSRACRTRSSARVYLKVSRSLRSAVRPLDGGLPPARTSIAAFLSPQGGSALLLQLIKRGDIIGITSQTVITEVLEEDKPTKLKRPRAELERFVAASGLLVREAVTPAEIAPYQGLIDADDAHLVAGATLTSCSHLVSLDKRHVLRDDVRQRFLSLRIVSPKELLQALLER